MKYILSATLLLISFPLLSVTSHTGKKSFGYVIDFNQTRHGSFDDAVKEAEIVVVDFSTDWCGPCKALAPTIQKLAESAEFIHIKFMKVNIDTNEAVANRFKIRNIPQLFFFKNGTVQHNLTLRGNQTAGTIKKAIKQLC